MFKKLALNIIIVVSVVFILDFAIGRTLRHFYFKETSGPHYRSTYSIDSTKADVLVLGSSRANHNYVPQVFEDSLHQDFYNTGRDGNGIFYQTNLLQSIIVRHTPQIIILEYSGEFEKRQVAADKVSALLPYYRTHPEIRENIDKESPLEKIKLLSEIYPFNSQALAIAADNISKNSKRNFDYKGYVPLYNEWKKELEWDKNTDAYQVDPDKVNAFKNFISIAKKNNIKLFVISSPIYQLYKNNVAINTCSQICKEENVPFMNFQNDTFFLNKRYLFHDLIHLNNNGAIEFSKIVANKIKHFQ